MKVMFRAKSIHATKFNSDEELEFVIDTAHITVFDDKVNLCLDNFGTYNRRTKLTGRVFAIREMPIGKSKYRFIRRIKQ